MAKSGGKNLWLILAIGIVAGIIIGIFLGQSLKVYSLKVYGSPRIIGTEVVGGPSDLYFLTVGQSVIVGGHNFTLLNVASGTSPSTIAFSVDGILGTVSGTNRKTVNCLDVQLQSTFYSDNVYQRSVNIYLTPSSQPCTGIVRDEFNVIKTNFTDSRHYTNGKYFCRGKGWNKCVSITKNYERYYFQGSLCSGPVIFKDISATTLDCADLIPRSGGGACGVSGSYSVSEGYSDNDWKVTCAQ
ncbi:hypothetical protein HYX18_03515 [Candidatus Woesearchaeota archaeon]|nr:hypothetical protein [Candidatus Woesearchaeota archaeon]